MASPRHAVGAAAVSRFAGSVCCCYVACHMPGLHTHAACVAVGRGRLALCFKSSG